MSLLILTGCKTTEWSNYPYDFSCDVFAPPYPPCVIDVSGDGFKYKGQFEACKAAVICQVVSLIKKGLIEKSFHEFAFDLAEVHNR